MAGFGIYIVHVHLSQSRGLSDGLELVAMMWGEEGGGERKSSFALVLRLPALLQVGERLQGLGQTFGEVLMLDYKVERQECGCGGSVDASTCWG